MVLCLVVNCGRKSGKRGRKKETDEDEHGPNQNQNEAGSGLRFSRVPTIITNEGEAMEDLTRERRRRWISALSRDDLTEKKLANDRVCNLHFVSGRAAKNWDRYNVDWVPTLRLGHSKKLGKDDARNVEQRAARAASRRKRRHDDCKHEVEEKMMKEDDSLHIASIFEIQDEPMPRKGDEIASNEAADMDFTVDPVQFCQPAEETRFCDAETNTDELDYLFQALAIKTEQFTQECFINDDAKVRFYTGLPSYDILQTTFDFVKPVVDGNLSTQQSFQQFILVLIKLRLNVPHQDLAYRFGLSVPTVSRIFKKWINILDQKLRPIISWPDREDLWRTMPKCFQYSFGKKVTVIIDCFEVFIERPSNLLARAQTYSNYKSHNTIKVLIGITPQGTVSFVSEAWGGRTSDKFLTDNCGILRLLKPGDLVMADRGFTIQESLMFHQAKLAIPAFTRGKDQLDPIDVEKTRGIANVRIHVERVIGLLRRKYTILQSTLPIDYLICSNGSQTPLIDKILRVTASLTNLCPSIVPFE